MKSGLVLTLLYLSTGVFSIAERLGCRDEGGNLIDWFYLYKLPNEFESNEVDREKNSGLEYMFITPTTMNEWIKSKKFINDSTSMPGRTLSPMYKESSENLVMMYNDEPTNGKTDGTRGHTKGVVFANDISGLWLVHSVPKYPPALEEGRYDFPTTGHMYGQSFLCISLTGDQMATVGKQLRFNEPHFYSSKVPDFLTTIYPELVQALEMETIKTAPFFNIEILKSRGGTSFLSFAKSGKFQKELYDDLVAPHYSAGDYFVETWRHGAGNIESDCMKPSKVYNVEEITFKSMNITFKTLNDHSKWMVSNEHDLICVGDINRQEHQKVRGGGTVCQQQSKLSAVYGSLVKAVENCKTNKIFDRPRISNAIEE